MNLFGRLVGVVGSFFQVGGPSGPAWKNNSGSLDARNAADSAYTNVRGLDPLIADDLVTKRYLSANSSSPILNEYPTGTTTTIPTNQVMPFASLKLDGTAHVVINGSGSMRSI